MKLLKKLFIIFAVVIVLVIGGAVIAITTFDPNDYKETIAEKVKEQTGRELSIDGDIEMTFYPWLSVDVSSVKLSNAEGFGEAPFLNAETFNVRAKLMPLLRKELEMDTLILHGVNLNLARNEEGVTNWDDLTKGDAKQAGGSSGGPPLAALVLGGIDVQNINILWQDKQNNSQTKISNLNISTGELLLGEPIEIKASMAVASTNPALSSDVELAGTVAYEDSGELLKLNPFTINAKVKGKEVPGGETDIKLTTDLQVDTNEEIMSINSLALTAFDTSVDTKLEISDYQSAPLVAGTLDIKGEDLPQLVRIFEIEALASQMADIKSKSFAINTTFDANLKRQDININPLTMNVLGNDINANLIARNVQSESPAIKGDIKAKGDNLPLLITLMSHLKGDSTEKITALNKQLTSVPGSFVIESAFDLDMQAGTVDLPTLAVDALGISIKGNMNGKQLQSNSPELTGSLAVNGKDMPSLVRIAAAMGSDGEQNLSSLTKQLKSVPADFSVSSKFDSGDGAIKMSELSIKALGLDGKGQLQVKNFLEDKPAIKGELTANGPNLPLLITIAGSMQGKESGLTDIGKNLSKIKDKKFTLTTKFDADMGSGNIALPDLSFQSLGMSLNGSLNANDVETGGAIAGQIKLASQSPKALLSALGQGELAKVMQSFSLGTDIKGNADSFSLKPLSMSAVMSGKDIPNSPVSLTVSADTDINLEKEVLTLNDFKADGLGLDLKGNLTAKNWSNDAALSGDINLAPFNLRQFLTSLKQPIPEMSDPKTLEKLALSSGITGTANSINLTGLKAELDDSKLQGDIKLASFSPLNLEFGLGLDQLNLDRYLPPQKDSKQAATPETVAAGAATKIPTDTLRAVTINGDFVMGKLIVSNATLTDMELSIRANEGNIKLSPIKAKLYEGTYDGNISLDATGKEPKLVTSTKLLGVQTGPLVKDVADTNDISGEANITLDLNSIGDDTDKLKKRLSGKGEIKFLEGIFRGVDVNKVLSQVEVMYESKRFGKIDTSGETKFQSLTATMDINNGVVMNDDMLMLGYGFKVKGEGMMVNLNDETWKYNMNVIVDSASATRGEERYNIGGYDILIKCRDKIMDKRCLPDLESMINALIKDTAKKKIQDKLGDAIGIDLNKLTGGNKESAPAEQAAEPTEQKQIQQDSSKQESQQKKQVKPEDIIKEEIGKGLEKLFGF
ncbi:MAG: AsmA family protein [Pseudomonadota bacterium]